MATMENYTTEVNVPQLMVPPPYNLLEAIEWLTPDPAGHWQGGVQWEADCPVSFSTVSSVFPGITGTGAGSGAAAGQPPLVPTWGEIRRGARAFTIYNEINITPVGDDGYTIDDALGDERDDVLNALAFSAHRRVERALWTGMIDNAPGAGVILYPNLNTTTQVTTNVLSTPPNFGPGQQIILQPSATLITGGFDVVESLGRLEEAIANCYRGTAWIHVPVVLASALQGRGLVSVQNGQLLTTAGNRVIVGRGYDSTVGHDGTTNPSGVSAMWATSPMFGLKSTPRAFALVETFDRSTNTMRAIAEQNYLIGWHCCLASITVTEGGLVSGAYGSAT